MLTKHIALVSLSKKITPSVLSQTAAALQKQVTRDLGPIWDISATIDYFPDIDSIPLGYWPIIIVENLNTAGAAGFHTDKHHQPYALVDYTKGWQLTCSHELCEMLVDPYGNRLMSAGSKDLKLGKVNFLVEVCDPCEDASFAYSINGILVSDFYTPNYFDPQAVNEVRYSYTGSITKPCQIKKNGYLSWQDPVSKKWFQATWFSGPAPIIKPLKGMKDFGDSLRSQVDRLTKNPNREKAFKTAEKKHSALQDKIFKSGTSKSDDWSAEISRFTKTSKGKFRKELAAEEDLKTAILTVKFKKTDPGLSSLTATLNDTSQTVTESGKLTFTDVSSRDIIQIDGKSLGSTTVTIDLPADPPKMEFDPGQFDDSFLIF